MGWKVESLLRSLTTFLLSSVSKLLFTLRWHPLLHLLRKHLVSPRDVRLLSEDVCPRRLISGPEGLWRCDLGYSVLKPLVSVSLVPPQPLLLAKANPSVSLTLTLAWVLRRAPWRHLELVLLEVVHV